MTWQISGYSADGKLDESSPAVATIDGKRRLFVSSLDGALYSSAANTGRLLWKLQTGSPLHSAPAIDGGPGRRRL